MSVQAGNRTNYFQLFLANGTILPDGIEADVAASRLSRRLVTAKLCEEAEDGLTYVRLGRRSGALHVHPNLARVRQVALRTEGAVVAPGLLLLREPGFRVFTRSQLRVELQQRAKAQALPHGWQMQARMMKNTFTPCFAPAAILLMACRHGTATR